MGDMGGMGALGTLRGAHAGARSVAVLTFALACLGAYAGDAFAAPFEDAGLGNLTLVASSEEMNVGSDLTLRVANDGEGPVTAVKLSVSTPKGAEAVITPDHISALPAKTSVLAVIHISGVPSTSMRRLEVRATGAAASGQSAAVASIRVAPTEPAVTLAIAGNTKLTDASPADLTIVVRNTGEEEVTAKLRGSAGQHVVRLAQEDDDISKPDLSNELEVAVAGQAAVLVRCRVEATQPLRRGTSALIITAMVNAPNTKYEVTATQSLDTTLSTDVLPSIVGLGSVLFVPGLVAVWVWLEVWSAEERRRGLPQPRPVSQIFDNKLWLLAAAALSAAAALVYSWLGFTNLFDTYALRDIALLSLVCGLLSLALAYVLVRFKGRGIPTFRQGLQPVAALVEAARFNESNSRSVFKTADNRLGLLVKVSDDALVLSPPIWFTELDPVSEALNNGSSLREVVTVLQRQGGYESKVIYAQDADDTNFISQPIVVRGAVPTAQAQVKILVPHDFEPPEAASAAP